MAGDNAFKWEKEFPNVFRQKEKQAFHVTWVTHNARTSQRMIEYKVKKGEAIWLDEELEMVVAKELATIIAEDKLNVLNWNICGDHVHMLLVCEPDELANTVRKLKGRSAQKTKEYLKVPKKEVFHLWAQKFNRKPVDDEDGLSKVYDYIQHNREKHNLPPADKGLQPLVEQTCCSYEKAFQPEYSGGFDVVIGNPPYGAKLSKDVQKYLTETFIKGGSETAISFIKLSYDLIKEKRVLSFIIPKSFSYASNYKAIRKFTLNDIEEIVDCGKVWSEVKLEQLIFSLRKNGTLEEYKSSLLVDKTIINVGLIDKESFKKYGLFLNGISDSEKAIGDKIWASKFRLKDIADNSRGGTFQKYISEEGEFVALGGAEIQRHGVVGEKGRIDKEYIKKEQKAFIKPNSVLAQNIVAHIKNPTDHIKITACLPDHTNYAIVDTINQITVEKDFDNRIIWYLLNSDILNWYCYRFIFGKAIRTMHFDNAVTDRIPIPKIDKKTQNEMVIQLSNKIELEMEFENLRKKFLELLTAKTDIEKLSRKLENWHELSFKQFLAELEKARKKATKAYEPLPLQEQAEWMDYFNQQKAKADELKAQITQTDKEIEAMVYELYGLTEEEVKIVEQS